MLVFNTSQRIGGSLSRIKSLTNDVKVTFSYSLVSCPTDLSDFGNSVICMLVIDLGTLAYIAKKCR